jgi:hypothetical protein
MEAMRSTWTDSRLDDLNGRVGKLNNWVDRLNQTMVHGFVAMFGAMLTGFLSLAALIATRL